MFGQARLTSRASEGSSVLMAIVSPLEGRDIWVCNMLQTKKTQNG
jgi:hypothetical protein